MTSDDAAPMSAQAVHEAYAASDLLSLAGPGRAVLVGAHGGVEVIRHTAPPFVAPGWGRTLDAVAAFLDVHGLTLDEARALARAGDIDCEAP